MFKNRNNPSSRPATPIFGKNQIPEKLAATACYVPTLFGLSILGFIIGLVYILAKGPGSSGNFFRFHFYQSIFLGLLSYCALMLGEGSTGMVIGFARLFEGVIGHQAVTWLGMNAGFSVLLFALPFFFLTLYGAIWSILGKFTTIPWVSKVIWNMLR